MEDPKKAARNEDAEVEGHRVRRSDEEAERARLNDDEGPEVEGHLRVGGPEAARKKA